MNALVFQTLDTEDEKTEKEGERLGEEGHREAGEET